MECKRMAGRAECPKKHRLFALEQQETLRQKAWKRSAGHWLKNTSCTGNMRFRIVIGKQVCGNTQGAPTRMNRAGYRPARVSQEQEAPCFHANTFCASSVFDTTLQKALFRVSIQKGNVYIHQRMCQCKNQREALYLCYARWPQRGRGADVRCKAACMAPG